MDEKKEKPGSRCYSLGRPKPKIGVSGNREAIQLLEETRKAIASLNERDRGIQAALTIGWEEGSERPQEIIDANPREWSPRRGGAVSARDVLEILESMGMELEQSDRDRERDVVSVALEVIYYAIRAIKENLKVPDAKRLRELAVGDFIDSERRNPDLP